jgi:ribonucleoside-diphosphate reductase beta chain
LRSRGLLQGLATGTSWVFRDESAHIEFALEVIATVRRERPDLFDESFGRRVTEMIREAVDCELTFAEDTLSMGVTGLSLKSMREYLEYVADRRLAALQLSHIYGSQNPFAFMELQDVQELTNFFERRVSAYQVGVTGDVVFAEDF